MSQVCRVFNVIGFTAGFTVGFTLTNIPTRHDIVFNVLRMSVVDYDYDVGKELTQVSSHLQLELY